MSVAPRVISVYVPMCMLCSPQHLPVWGSACAFAQEGHVFLSLYVFTFAYHPYLIIPSACFPQPRLPPPRCTEFPSFLFFHSRKCQEGSKKCAQWMDGQICYSATPLMIPGAKSHRALHPELFSVSWKVHSPHKTILLPHDGSLVALQHLLRLHPNAYIGLGVGKRFQLEWVPFSQQPPFQSPSTQRKLRWAHLSP